MMNKKKPGSSQRAKTFQNVLISLATLLAVGSIYLNSKLQAVNISEHRFEKMMKEGVVEKVVLIANKQQVEVTLKKEALQKEPYKQELKSNHWLLYQEDWPHYRFRIPSNEVFDRNFKQLESSISGHEKLGYETENRSDLMDFILNWGYLLLLIFGFIYMMRRMSGSVGGGGAIFNIGKSKAKLFDSENKVNITFNNVAGLDEAKEELIEIVDFLKNPNKFTALGGKIPKGALLIGEPGTGKTLLAKAVAGEAGVPFFSLSGSDFVEMFVGVGSARVRDLFERAKEKSPCIIFIDEIDAVGRSRGKGNMPGSNDERENTLNSLLVEMDGFGSNSGVILLGATNRPDVLDRALLRPGRFDRQISIGCPDIKEREAIFKEHLKPIKTSKDIDPKKLAEQTPGFVGAEIANVCNEAALIAARRRKKRADDKDFQEAMDRVIGGLEKKNKIISPEEKKIVAYHEAGHALAGWFLEHADPLVKVTIVPRGIAALGYAQYLPKEQFLYQTDQLIDDICMSLGGRAAEELIFGKISTGALSDLERVTQVAYSLITVYGMNPKLGNVSFYHHKKQEYAFEKPYSESTATMIDEEVRTLISNAYDRAKDLLKGKLDDLHTVAQALLKKEVLFQKDLEAMVGPRPKKANPQSDATVQLENAL